MNLSEQDILPIGGYFELELPIKTVHPYEQALKFQSARAAFLALLRAGKPKRVWLPRYICDSMQMPLQAAEVECVWYDVDAKLAVDSSVRIGADDWLLYVNYYGLHKHNVQELLQRFPPEQIVFDFSQSFFDPPVDAALATIYSPRKFFGVPDGGLLICRTLEIFISTQDIDSLERSVHLMKRMADSPEAGYVDYQYAEETLSDCEPRRMSKLTEHILGSIDFDIVRRRRHDNFMFLHRALGEINLFDIDSLDVGAPLCYPFMTNNPGLREKMIKNRIFVPTYWQDAITRVGGGGLEKMVKNLLPLPIDQRYDSDDMGRIVSVILEEIL